MRRVRKIALWLVGVTAVLLVAAWFGLKAYVNSSHVRQTAGTQLSDAIGLPVQVDELSVGSSTTSASLHVADSAAPTPTDFVRVGSLVTDVSLLDLVGGRVAPTTVTVKDLDVLLRLDAENRVATALPKPKAGGGEAKTVPAVQVTGGRFRIQQPGHPDFDLGGITAKLVRDGEAYALTGDADDPKWGKWKLTGRLMTDPTDVRLELQTDDAPLDEQLLRSIPAVPGSVWDEIKPDGRGAATVTLSFKAGDRFRYAVDVRPHKAKLTLPELAATVTDVEGLIKVRNGRVDLEGGRLGLGGGSLTIDGPYDFSQPSGVFTPKVTAAGVDLQQLPAGWHFPKQITGKLRGRADLEVHFPPKGPVDTRGTGQADVEDAKLAGIPAKLRLKLSGGEGKYRFTTD